MPFSHLFLSSETTTPGIWGFHCTDHIDPWILERCVQAPERSRTYYSCDVVDALPVVSMYLTQSCDPNSLRIGSCWVHGIHVRGVWRAVGWWWANVIAAFDACGFTQHQVNLKCLNRCCHTKEHICIHSTIIPEMELTVSSIEQTSRRWQK